MAITTPTTASSSSHTMKLRRPTRVLKVVKVQGSGLLPPEEGGGGAGQGGFVSRVQRQRRAEHAG
jgi:hypothetical protein